MPISVHCAKNGHRDFLVQVSFDVGQGVAGLPEKQVTEKEHRPRGTVANGHSLGWSSWGGIGVLISSSSYCKVNVMNRLISTNPEEKGHPSPR